METVVFHGLGDIRLADVPESRTEQPGEADPAREREGLLFGLLQDEPHIEPKFFYDAQGCALFGAICQLDEYYPTRTEAGIFTGHLQDIAARLPSEAEWEHAANHVTAPMIEGSLLEDAVFHPGPCRAGPDHLGQLFGDCWEWTQSAYLPYPGYRPAAGAVGEYNGKFMVNQMVLRGGSCASPRDHLRASYRNFFPPSARWQFSGIRLARSFAG